MKSGYSRCECLDTIQWLIFLTIRTTCRSRIQIMKAYLTKILLYLYRHYALTVLCSLLDPPNEDLYWGFLLQYFVQFLGTLLSVGHLSCSKLKIHESQIQKYGESNKEQNTVGTVQAHLSRKLTVSRNFNITNNEFTFSQLGLCIRFTSTRLNCVLII